MTRSIADNVGAGRNVTYTYDGNSLRVKKISGSTTTVYIFSGGKVIGEYVNGAAPGSPTREYMYFGNRLLSTLEGGATKYHLRDHLSARVSTDATGAVIGQQGHFPFGEFWYSTSTTTKWQFTSYERDAESGNDYAMVRCYANRLGRFSSPDPVLGNMHNPQRLNRYAYALNDPLNLIDPLGLDCVFLNDIGDDIEFIDSNSSFEECSANGGFWADGRVIGGWIDPNSDNVLLLTRGWDADGNVQYGWTQAGTLQGPGGVTWSSATQWAYPTANGDVPLTPFAQAVLGQVYQNSSAVTNPVNIALWYGASAVGGVGLVYGPAAYSAVYFFAANNPAAVVFGIQLAQGLVPGAPVPPTPAGMLGRAIQKAICNQTGALCH